MRQARSRIIWSLSLRTATYNQNSFRASVASLVVHQCWIDGYKDFNFMRASAVVKRQSTFMAS